MARDRRWDDEDRREDDERREDMRDEDDHRDWRGRDRDGYRRGDDGWDDRDGRLPGYDDEDDRGPKPKNYLTESILVTLCCCMPFGIAAIVNAASVDGSWARGDRRAAERASGQAKMWCWVALGLGLVGGVIRVMIEVAAEQAGRR